MVLRPDQYIPGTIRDIASLKRKKGNQRTKKTQTIYKDKLLAFDIETTRLTGKQHPRFISKKGENEAAIMYVWMFHFNGYATIVGRTWAEFHNFLKTARDELEDNESIVIWVHNLSYEFQFLRGIYHFSSDEVFCLNSRKILKATMYGGKIEFRCSYLHSNMSLDEYTKKMKVEHHKLSGEKFDYDKIRYPWTPLTSDELAYCLHDVIGLCEALEVEMGIDGDNLYSIPLTSTGYVRRDIRKAMATPRNKKLIHEIFPDEDVFALLRDAFGGGNTHANRHFAGRIIENVKSMDRSSSYPDTQCNDRYPVGEFTKFGAISLKELEYLITTRKKAVVVKLAFHNIRLADFNDGCPYICRSHCTRCEGFLLDNGRILSADYLETTVTDVDLKIILAHYDCDEIDVICGAFARYGKLPPELIKVICGYYKNKTELKDVPGMEVYYTKDKNKLNAIYGMTATNPAKQDVLFIEGAEECYERQEEELSVLLQEARERAFITYAWGVWCTAIARSKLQAGIDRVQSTPGAYFIYCDTDSVKYIGVVDMSDFNNASIEASKKSGACAKDPNGIMHYMGVFEQEKTYAQFATLGAKKYAFRYELGGPTYVTIAGVTKAKGGAELDRGDKYGRGLERFCDTDHPFVFREAGGTEIIYQDSPDPTPIIIDGHSLVITPCAVIRPSTYTLGITAEYESLIKNGVLGLEIWQHI